MLLLFLASTHGLTQLEWRVSVKFILDSLNNRPASGDINTDAKVQERIDSANALPDIFGRGYRFRITEFVNIDSVW